MAKDNKETDPSTEFAKGLRDKAPNSIKEVTKVLIEMTSKFIEAMNKLTATVTTLGSSTTDIKTELTSFRASMKFMNDCFEEFKGDVKTFWEELTEVKNRSLECHRENERLNREMKDVRRQLVELKQYSRKNNLELKGVPFTESEDLKETLKQITTRLGVDVPSQNIDVVHRVASKGLPNIIVKFNSRSTRDSVLQAAKKNRLNTAMLGFATNEPIYINEHLCPENKVLLGKAISAKREKNWKFAWVSDAKILMRKSEKAKVLHITCEDDLVKVV